jgi:hypothetical protein
MTITLMVLGALVCVQVGWLSCWFTFDHFFYKPQQKLLKDSIASTDKALKGWEESINLLNKVHVMAGGVSIVSPIQIKKD